MPERLEVCPNCGMNKHTTSPCHYCEVFGNIEWDTVSHSRQERSST